MSWACDHYTLSRRDLPCAVPGCKYGHGHPSILRVCMGEDNGGWWLMSDGIPPPPKMQTERWERAQLAIPGEPEPIWAWRKEGEAR